jgi:hypothetical protein
MRRTAYLKALDEANNLPDKIPELLRYFSREYSPRMCAITYIKELARKDTELLFDSECLEVLQWEPTNAEDHKDTTNNSQDQT